ncbi:MAG: hypothetical protein HFG01_09700 [Oscillibacter sp.]|nr:hypothetical protein [Oscillibacter sp.]
MWRWILLSVCVLLALLCLTRVGVEAAFGGGRPLRLDVRLGPLRLHILPGKKRAGQEKPKKEKKARKEKKKPPEEPEKKKRKKLPFKPEDVKDGLRTLFTALGRALRRIGRGVRLHPFRLSLTLGGREDPAAAAENYGRVQTAVWNGMPVLERLMDIPEPSIHTGVDFDAAGTEAEGDVGVTFRIGTLLALGFGLIVPALGWLWRFWQRSRKRAAAKAAGEAKSAKRDRTEKPADAA